MSDSYTQYTNYYNMKRIRTWRFLTFFILILIMIGLFFNFSEEILNKPNKYIAEIEIEGMIIDAGYQAKEIRSLRDDNAVEAVIISINSPGGTTYDSEILFDALKYVAEKKPVVSYMKNVAASGGYIVALAGEKIFAAKNTLTGSIGVLMQAPNFKELLNNIGISVLEIKSSPIKGEPNYHSDPPRAALDNLQNIVDDTNNWFSELVLKQRPEISKENISDLANGSVFTGQQAVNNHLVDAIGGQSEALAYLIKHYQFFDDIKVLPVSIEEEVKSPFLDRLVSHFSSTLRGIIKNIIVKDTNKLDGLLSLWQI